MLVTGIVISPYCLYMKCNTQKTSVARLYVYATSKPRRNHINLPGIFLRERNIWNTLDAGDTVLGCFGRSAAEATDKRTDKQTDRQTEGHCLILLSLIVFYCFYFNHLNFVI